MNKAAIIVPIFFVLSTAAWGGWKSETVASEGDVGGGCCLAVDRWGRPHISYVDKTQGKVMYARYSGSSWELDTVASDVEVPGNTALALDAYDEPYVVFQDNEENELKYAYRSGTNWVTEGIAAGTELGYYLSVNVWPTNPRVSYTQPLGTNVRLKYAYRDTGEWYTETAVSSGGGNFNTLFIDNAERPNIVYWNHSSLSVRHAVRDGSEWSIDDIAEGIDCDALLGPDGKIHVSFAKVNNKGLNYAVSTSGGSWDIENIAAVKGLPAFTQICVNGTGDVFISYFNFDKWDLRIMTKRGGSWTHEIVATGAYVGLPHSSAISGRDPVIAYYDSDNKDLKLARYVTDVELTSFKAVRNREAVDIRWTVDGAEGVAGYNLYRAADEAKREKVNRVLIEGSSPFLYCDDAAAATVGYRYWLEAVTTTGTGRTFGPVSVPPAPKARAFALYQNVPNPAPGATTFSFELAEGSDVKLVIYDAAGRKVGTVADGYFAAGRHDVPFQGNLAPGVYVYRIDAGSRTAARKMVVVE